MDSIQIQSAPPHLAWAIDGFVKREAQGTNIPVLLLPEVRPSIQIFVQAPYWTRQHQEGCDWVQACKAAVWGPRYELAYGWSEPDILVCAAILTAEGCRALLGKPAGYFANQAIALDSDFAHELVLAAQPRQSLNMVTQAFCAIIAPRLCSKFKSNRSFAALSERQQRRRMIDEWGIAPKKRQRLKRLDLLIRSLHRNPWEGPEPTPPELGFSDQSHMIRECVKLTSLTPLQIKKAMQATRSVALRSIEMPDIRPPETSLDSRN